ncbi:hypothetical protein [Micromonospora globbae]|jgi:hypothetical protein|uniref:Uncharacterized protein n=1 Tax=Micromonospora globbae TaxID=1894969 RepID=A0A420F429_9ACTN|nr:hypothetical protein [Micromonospora globbae]RKF27675.1 hypothetical protein D7I43_08205 [Micromonospora globbae]WTF86832.1 hypothetical protein OH732_04315 [Micromonospora globbae]
MSQPTSIVRWAAAAAALALLTGCQTSGTETGGPAPTTPAAPTTGAASTPTTSPSPVTAANTVEVCQAVDRLVIAASRKIAADSTAATERELTGEQISAQLRRTLGDLADDVRAQARRAQDQEVRALLGDTADRIDAGARAQRPAAWLDSTFTRIPATLMRECRP